MLLPLIRPSMPTQDDETRSVYCRMRRKILDENYDREAAEYLEQLAGSETAQLWGAPDTSLNPLASHSRQLTTPGLYGRAPTCVYPEGGEFLMGPDGLWEEAGIWARNQSLQYLTVGSGIWFRRLHLVDVGRGAQLVDRLVDPADVYVEVDEAAPMVPIVFKELRLRTSYEGREPEQFYAWDCFDISNPERPTYKVIRCDGQGDTSEDVTAQFAGQEIADGKYEWRTPEGLPFLPYVTYRAVDAGCFWPMWRRSIHRGTLRATAHWTYTGRAALFATGEHLLVSGIEGLPGAVQHGDHNQQQHVGPVNTIRVQPGTITVVEQKAQQQMSSIKIGPGVNLPNLLEFSNTYGMLLAAADGLAPDDVMRQAANPTSGAALAISDRSRREFSAQVQPFFRSSDMMAIRKAAWMANAAGHRCPDRGYSLSYHTVPLTPSEQEDLRKDLEWKRKQGQISSVDEHLALFPGKTREQAVEAIVAARVEEERIERAVKERLEEEGLEDESGSSTTSADGTGEGAAAASDTALNGAQVTSLIELVVAVTERRIPRESALAMIVRSFQVDEPTAQRMLGPAGQTFFAPTPTATPTTTPGGGTTPPAQE